MRFMVIPEFLFLFLSLSASSALAVEPDDQVVEVTDIVECEGLCRAYLPALPDVVLTAPSLTTPSTAFATEGDDGTWTETVTVSCLGDKHNSVPVTCSYAGERLSPLQIEGCGPKIVFNHTCGVDPTPEPTADPTMVVAPEGPEASGFFVGARYRHLAVINSAAFNGAEGFAGYRHYVSDSGPWFFQVDGGIGGGEHLYLVDDSEPNSAVALASLAARFGVRPIESLNLSLGVEGMVIGNGTETLMDGVTGVLQAEFQVGIVRFGGWCGVGLSHHSDPTSRATWNGQSVDDVDALPAHAQANVLFEHGFEASLDPVLSTGVSLVVELP